MLGYYVCDANQYVMYKVYHQVNATMPRWRYTCFLSLQVSYLEDIHSFASAAADYNQLPLSHQPRYRIRRAQMHFGLYHKTAALNVNDVFIFMHIVVNM